MPVFFAEFERLTLPRLVFSSWSSGRRINTWVRWRIAWSNRQPAGARESWLGSFTGEAAPYQRNDVESEFWTFQKVLGTA